MDGPSQLHETIAGQLAGLVADTDYSSLPASVIAAAKRLVLDQLGCELIGSTMPWVEPAFRLAALAEGARPESTVVNQGLRLPAPDAAFINATYGQACELDDATFGSAGHIGTATVPVALALGQSMKISGVDFLTAVVIGYEVMYRLMSAVRPHHRIKGFHSQGIGGPFAAAAVGAKILKLSRNEITHALAIAGSHSSGPLEYDQAGGEVKRVHAGIAAKGGLQSALLAKFGLTGPPTIIEGPRGFCNLFADHSDLSKITNGLGETWNIGNAWFKIYPVVGGVQTSISAVKSLMADNGIKTRDVARVRVGLTESALLHCAAIRRPHDMLSAQFSLAYSVALAVCGRANVLDDYMNTENWRDAEIEGVAEKVHAYADPEAVGERDFMSRVSIDCRDRRTFEAVEVYPRGSPRNPASQQDLVMKFKSLSAAVLSTPRAQAVLDVLENLEALDDISRLSELLISDRTEKTTNPN